MIDAVALICCWLSAFVEVTASSHSMCMLHADTNIYMRLTDQPTHLRGACSTDRW